MYPNLLTAIAPLLCLHFDIQNLLLSVLITQGFPALFHPTSASLHSSSLSSLTNTPCHGIQLSISIKIAHLIHLRDISRISLVSESHPFIPVYCYQLSHIVAKVLLISYACVLVIFLIQFHFMTPISTPKATRFLYCVFRFSFFTGNVSKLCQLQHFISTFLIYAPRSLMKMLNKMSQTDP